MKKQEKIIKINLKKLIRNILILIGFTVLITFILTKNIYSYDEPKEKYIYIAEGDTLWDIAKIEKKFNPYYSGKNIQDIMYEIKDLNNMKDSSLRAGNSLKVYCK